MLPVFEALLVLLVAFVPYFLFRYRDVAIGCRRRDDIPGPKGLPLLGNVVFVVKSLPRFLEVMGKLFEEYGDALRLTAPGISQIAINRPEWVEHVQKTNFKNYEKGWPFREAMGPFFGQGIFVVDHELWQMQRKATSHIFSARSFKGIITQALSDDLEILRGYLANKAKSGEPFDMRALLFRFTLQSFVQMAFGTDLKVMREFDAPPVAFASAFDYAQEVMAERFLNPAWKIAEVLDGRKAKMAEAKKTVDDFVYSVMHDRASEKIEDVDLLSLYMAIRDDKGVPLSAEEVRDSVLSLIIAGHVRDTTAQALSWTLFYLIKNPDLVAPMRKEISDQLGASDPVTYDNYKNLVEVNAVWNEGLRLHPSVPKNAWIARGDDILPNGGPRVQKGEFVMWSDWVMGRDTRLWGPDAREFKPSRWIDEAGNLKRESQWKFHAFNGGFRLCLGQALATFEGVSFLVEAVRAYDFHYAPGWLESVPKTTGVWYDEQVPMYGLSLTMPMQEPFMVTAHRRS